MKTSNASKRNNSKAKSIEIENETDEENEIEVTELEAAVAASKYETGWAQGGLQRDHLIQTLLKLTESFGVYRSVAGEVVDGQVSYQDVFYKGTYALENVEGLRQYLNEEDSPKTRELMIHISKYNIMAKYIVPLFCMAVDDKPLAVSILRLLLLLTKPPAADTKRALVHPIRPRTSKESAEQSRARVEREKKDRANAYDQVSALLSFKASLTTDDVFSVVLSRNSEEKQMRERQRLENVFLNIQDIDIAVYHTFQQGSGMADDGSLSRSEFARLFANIRGSQAVDDKEVNMIFDLMDTNADGAIYRKEFIVDDENAKHRNRF